MCVKNGRKHGGMKHVKKLKNWNGNTKPKGERDVNKETV